MERELVLLHGWGMTRRVWEPVLAGLASTFRIHNLCLPGYAGGAEADAAGNETMTGQDMLDRWTDRVLEEAPAAGWWVGWSLGALVAMNAVLRAPGRVGAAVLVSATPKFTRGDDWDAGVEPGVMHGFLEGMRTNDERTLKRFVLLQAGGLDEARTLAGCAAGGEAGPGVLEAGLRVLEDVDLRARLNGVNVPVRVVHGSEDRIVPPAAGAHLARDVPAGDLVRLDAGHAPFVSRPREFVEAVAAWR